MPCQTSTGLQPTATLSTLACTFLLRNRLRMLNLTLVACKITGACKLSVAGVAGDGRGGGDAGHLPVLSTPSARWNATRIQLAIPPPPPQGHTHTHSLSLSLPEGGGGGEQCCQTVRFFGQCPIFEGSFPKSGPKRATSEKQPKCRRSLLSYAEVLYFHFSAQLKA